MKLIKSFGLIGFPLTHSFSKKYFTEKFETENVTNSEYHLFPIKQIEQLPTLISTYPTLRGLSVTIPYKEIIIPFLDELDKTAQSVGAVNCIKISYPESRTSCDVQAPHLTGFNTDIFGFKQSIKPFLESQHERALILGTGGVAKAVHYVLKEIGIDCYFVSRHKTHNTSNKIFSYDELNSAMMNAFKLIVNATPLGMFPNVNEAPEIPYQFITSPHLLYDVVYNPVETEFLKLGKKQGASVVNGLSMLHQQAEEAWRIWNV